jgi:hypothetical protein
MLRVLRRTRFATFFALLVLSGGIPVSMAELFHDADDVLCAPALVVHDEAAHRIRAAGAPAPQPQHCAVCHWLQSLQTVRYATGIVAPPADCHRLAVSAIPIAGAIALGNLSARAPPLA